MVLAWTLFWYPDIDSSSTLCDKIVSNVLAITDRSKEQQAGVAGSKQCVFSGRIEQLAGKAEYPS